MTTDQIVLRVSGAKKISGRWAARCPSHDDKAPSLSIAIGRDGRTLLRCFAGCEIDQIVAALGLELRDLFEADGRTQLSRRAQRSATPTDVRSALKSEAEQFRARLGVLLGNELLTGEKNSVRRLVAARLGITLPVLEIPYCEGNYAGRERDPWWPLIFERAWEELWFERGTPPPYTLSDRLRAGRALEPRSRLLIEDRAASIHRAFALAGKKAR